MKSLLALAVIIGIVAVTFKIHQDRVDAAANRAAAIAAENARAEMARAEKARAKRTPATPAPPELHAVSLSQPLEQEYADVFSAIDLQQPADLVIPLELTRERILDEMTRVPAGEKPIYQAAADVVATFIDSAEERTKTIHAALRAATTATSALDVPGRPSSSRTFFSQGVKQRWDEQKKQLKQRADQMFVRLRTLEREWNSRAGAKAEIDSFERPVVRTVYITAEPQTTTNPLERGAYNQRRNVYSWRRGSYPERVGSSY
jgi:uncharacterized protein HemX